MQLGRLSVQIDDNTASDFALLSLTVAVETPDAGEAVVRIDNGGQVTVDSVVPAVGSVNVAGSDGQLVLEPGGELEVIGEMAIGDGLPGSLALGGGRLWAHTVRFGDAATLSVTLGDPALFDVANLPVETSDLLLGGVLELTALEGFDPKLGDEYFLFGYDTRRGTFDSVVRPPGFEHISFDLAFDDAAGYGTLSVSAVAEPSAVALLGAGAAGLGLFALRRRRGPAPNRANRLPINR